MTGLLMAALALGIITATVVESNVDTYGNLTGCFMRSFEFNATNANGNCWEIVHVLACWGKCLSWEIGRAEPPFTETYHPVCIYKGFGHVTIPLTHCRPGFAEETYQTINATKCACAACDSDKAKCSLL